MDRLRMFSKEIEPRCAYCRHGTPTRDGQAILCDKMGVTAPHVSCKKFLYAPLKRVPRRLAPLPQFDPSDFEL